MSFTGSPVVTYARNTVGRDLIVGDVHGCFDKLSVALAEINFDDTKDRLFSVGDLVDRGPGSAFVGEWLCQPWFHAIRGNHEEMMVGYHDGEVPAQLYYQNGGPWFIGMTPEERLPYVDAVRELPLAIELDTCAGMVVLIHAEMAAGCAWADWRRRLMAGDQYACISNTWARQMADDPGPIGAVPDIRAVVAGHTPTVDGAPMMRGNRFWIDTGAWLQAGKTDRKFCILDAHTLAPATGGTAQLDLRGFGG